MKLDSMFEDSFFAFKEYYLLCRYIQTNFSDEYGKNFFAYKHLVYKCIIKNRDRYIKIKYRSNKLFIYTQ